MKTRKAIATATLLCILAIPALSKRAMHNIMSNHPVSYNTENFMKELPRLATTRGEYTGFVEDACGIPHNTDMNAIYLGLQQNPLKISTVKPTALTDNANTYYDPGCAVRFEGGAYFATAVGSEIAQRILDMKIGDAIRLPYAPTRFTGYASKTGQVDNYSMKLDIYASGYTLSVGKDTKGKYLSFYDVWDFSPGQGGYYQYSATPTDLAALVLPHVGTPIHLYKRFYFVEHGVTDESLLRVVQK